MGKKETGEIIHKVEWYKHKVGPWSSLKMIKIIQTTSAFWILLYITSVSILHSNITDKKIK